MRRHRVGEVDFNDEEAVLAEMARELDIDPDDLKIRDASRHRLTGGGTLYEITIKGGSHGKEWMVIENEDQEREMALEIVKQDLESEPEIFNQSFIEQHIDTDRLRRDLTSDVESERYDYWKEADVDDFWKEYEREGFSAPEEDEDGNLPDPDDSQIVELADKQAEAQLKDPMEYLEDIYGREDAVKEAIKIAGIDVDAAAEDAIDTDGAAHFLSSYDGSTTVSKSGLVYWRSN